MALNIYTLNETAEILKVTPRTVLNYIHTGELKASKLGRDWRITEDSINDLLALKLGAKRTNKKKDI